MGVAIGTWMTISPSALPLVIVLARPVGRRSALEVGETEGERQRNVLLSTSVGYAVRMEEVREWAPELVGRSLLLEANNAPSPTDRA